MAHAAPSPDAAPRLAVEHDFHTVTCVVWSGSGRNFGLGTPGGFLLYSVEPLLAPTPLSSFSSSHSPPPPPSSQVGVVEVCRRVVHGGVGVLSLYHQSSVVALSGVRSRREACTLQLVDAALPGVGPGTSSGPSQGAPVPPVSDACDAKRTSLLFSPPLEAQQGLPTESPNASPHPMTLAAAEFPETVAGLRHTPYFVIAIVTGDPNVLSAQRLFVFDHTLQEKYRLSLFPPRNNRFLQDTLDVATNWVPAHGAGMSIKWFRAMLPGARKGEVRLLTLRHVTPTAPRTTSSLGNARREAQGEGSNGGERFTESPPELPSEVTFGVNELVVHQSRLRAVAISPDGRRGVTIGESGTKIQLLEFVEDTKMTVRATLDRGRTAAVVDSVSLRVLTLPGRGGGGGGAHDGNGHRLRRRDLVVCVTSSGTVHLYLCEDNDSSAPQALSSSSSSRQQLLYVRDKALCPPGRDFPFAFAAMLSPSAVWQSTGALFVLWWPSGTGGLDYLVSHEDRDRPATNATLHSPPSPTHTHAVLPVRVTRFWLSWTDPLLATRERHLPPSAGQLLCTVDGHYSAPLNDIAEDGL